MKAKKYAEGGELPQDLTDRLARQSNKEDKDLIMAPVRAAGKAIKKNLEEGAKEHQAPKPRMNMGKLPGKAAAEKLGMQDASDVEKNNAAVLLRKGFSDEDAKDMSKQKAYKAGGKVRGCGIAQKGLTKGRMV